MNNTFNRPKQTQNWEALPITSRAEALNALKKNDLAKISRQIRAILERKLEAEKERLTNAFLEQFATACANILELQRKDLLGRISFITITVLRTHIIVKDYNFPIKVCSEHWWLDRNQQDVGRYDARFFFTFYEQMREKLEYERHKYVGKTIEQDVDAALSAQIGYFLKYIAQIARYKINQAIATDTFQQIKKNANVEIHVGEYLDQYELVSGISNLPTVNLLPNQVNHALTNEITNEEPDRESISKEYFGVAIDKDFMRGMDIKPLSPEELKGQQPVVRHVKWSETFESTVLADYITTSTVRGRYHLISDRLKELCAIYDKQQTWMPIIFINQRRYSYVYWFWQPQTIDCLSEQTTYNIDRTIKKLAINTKDLASRNQFIVATPIQKMIVVRLDLAESMLRRGFIGFKLRQVALAKVEG